MPPANMQAAPLSETAPVLGVRPAHSWLASCHGAHDFWYSTNSGSCISLRQYKAVCASASAMCASSTLRMRDFPPLFSLSSAVSRNCATSFWHHSDSIELGDEDGDQHGAAPKRVAD